jgi:Ser-tRNA(Ala) deacylase AlaX
MATKKLFWDDPYLKECKSKITRIEEDRIYLDQTIFYAFSGGQESDSGYIARIKVIEAKKEGDEISYSLDTNNPILNTLKLGDVVKVEIDWEKRFRLMRLHSAAHIVFRLLEVKFNVKEVIGSNITVEKARLDFMYPENVSSHLDDILNSAKKLIQSNLAINTYYDELDKTKRVWQLADFAEWKMFCGGTHVKSSGEIGEILLKRKNIGQGKERIEIVLV